MLRINTHSYIDNFKGAAYERVVALLLAQNFRRVCLLFRVTLNEQHLEVTRSKFEYRGLKFFLPSDDNEVYVTVVNKTLLKARHALSAFESGDCHSWTVETAESAFGLHLLQQRPTSRHSPV
jgi:hypothetical protein